jgi:DNA-binding transcriptional regulator GbsR (MarR family)
MRKNSTRIIWVVIIIFVSLGIGSTVISSKQSGSHVGEIFGKKIKYTRFEEAYKMVYFSPRIQNLIQSKKDVTNQMLEDSTFQHLAFQMEANKRGIKVSDDDVKNEIIRRFTVENNFNPKIYEHWVTNVTGMPLHTYEEGIRKDLLVTKLIDRIRDDISITEEEIADYFYKQNRTIKADYIFTAFDQFKKDVSFTEPDLVAYYQENIDLFKTEKKYKIIYAVFSPEKYIGSISVTEEELIDYFEEYKANSPERDENIPAFSEMKESIEQQLKYEKAERRSQEAALTFKNSVLNIAKLQESAAQQDVPLKTTGLIPFSEVSDEIGWSNDLFKAIDTLGPRRLIVLQTSKGSIVLQMLDVADPETIAFRDAFDKVKEEYIRFHAAQKAEDILTRAFDESNVNGSSLKELAEKSEHISMISSEPFGINDAEIFDQETTLEVFNILWNKETGFLTRPLRLKNDSYALFKLTERIDPPREEFELAKDSIREQILRFKQYFELQQELSEILSRADIKKYNPKTDISDR